MWDGRQIEAFMIGACINKLMLDRRGQAGDRQPEAARMLKLHHKKTG